MGHMQSPSKTIEYLDFKPIPNRKPVKGQIVTVGSTTVIKGERGALYTNKRPLNNQAYCAGNWDWSDEITECLDLLGILTPEDKAKHSAWIHKCEARDKAVSAMGDAIRALKVPALNTPKAQKAVMAMWDAMDWIGQANAKRYGYMPEGAILKECPSKIA